MRIEHVALNVTDREAARDFFVDYFGGCANDPYHNPRSYFITVSDGARVEVMTNPSVVDDPKALDRSG